MDEEVKQEVKQEEVKSQEREYSTTEQEAMRHGWRPQEEFDGHPDDFVSAREYINRKSLFDRISRDKHKLDKLEKTVQALVAHNEKVYQAGYQQAMDELNAVRDEAIREGDRASQQRAEEQMRNLQHRIQTEGTPAQQAAAAASQAKQVHPAWEPWLENNEWYNKNPELHGAADGIAQGILNEARSNGVQLDFAKVLDEVGRKIRQRYPEEFGHQIRSASVGRGDDKRNSAEGKGQLSRTLKSIENEMDDGEREIMNTILQSTNMTKEKYLSDIAATRRGRR